MDLHALTMDFLGAGAVQKGKKKGDDTREQRSPEISVVAFVAYKDDPKKNEAACKETERDDGMKGACECAFSLKKRQCTS